MPNFFCFRPDHYKYFGCIPIQVALGVALFVVLGTQYYASIFFLIFHVWYWFIALFLGIAAHALLFWAIYSRKSILFIPVLIYEAMFVLLMIGSGIWMIVDVISPWQSLIYRNCQPDYSFTYGEDNYNCISQTRTLAGIHIAVFFSFALLNIFVFDVFFRFRIYIDSGNHRPAVNVVSGGVVSPIPLQPDTNSRANLGDPAHNVIYSPGNPYPPQPLSPNGVPPVAVTNPQPAYNPSYQPYPTVRGPVAPAYPSAPTQQLQHMYEAPPAYSPSDKY